MPLAPAGPGQVAGPAAWMALGMSVSDSPIASLRASHVRPIRRREITHARELATH